MMAIAPAEEQRYKEFRSNLQENKAILDSILGDSVDLQRREFVIQEEYDAAGICYFTDGLVNTNEIDNLLKSMMISSRRPEISGWIPQNDPESLKNRLMISHSIKLLRKVEDGVQAVLSGDTLILIDGCDQAFTASTRGWDARSVQEPSTENVVRGPRDGFTESIRTNTAHIRRRIRDPRLQIDSMKIGERTKTDINIAYLKGIAKEGLVEEVNNRLNRIRIDGILESGYIEELIEDAPWSPFNTILSTERPDKVASAILEGRVAIFVDNTPFVLLAPVSFWQFIQAADDYYNRFWGGSFFRVVRYLAFLISLTLPSLYVMLVSFHQEMIPTGLALTIASGREVVPFPVLLEALIMEFAFELMREAGLRMPKPVGQAVSIVGSLVIGQAAVQAGVVSPFMVIVVAVTGIASFSLPSYGNAIAIRLLRFPILIASGSLGLLGFAGVFFLVMIHALSIRSFGESYLAPATPFRPSDQKDLLFRFPWWGMKKRPQMAAGDPNRLGPNPVPQPPERPSADKPAGAQSGRPSWWRRLRK